MASSGAAATRYLASELRSHRALIVELYRDRLESAGNAVIHDPEAYAGAIAHVDQLLTELSCALEGAEPPGAQTCASAGGDAIEGRSRYGVDPGDSFEASSLLFDAVSSALVEIIPPDARATAAFRDAVNLLERGITARTRAYFLTYLAHLSERIHEAGRDERRRIARELHDRIGQGLSAAQLQLELYDLYRDSDPAAAAVKVDTARRAVQEAILSLRGITSDLHTREPVTSLALALMSYVESAGGRDVDVSVRVNGNDAHVPADVRDESFLILREALRNALRHAKPTKVAVDVAVTGSQLVASVADDGAGFDAVRTPESDGMGLTSMKERAELLGGSVVVSSSVGHGTTVRYRVPLGAAGA